MPPLMNNHGNYVVSLGNVCRWLAEKAEALGVEIYPGFAAAELLINDAGAVYGVATGDMGIGRDGKPTANHTPEFQRFKTHPMIAPTFEGAKRVSYGARAISEGGFQSVPKLAFPGGALIGCAAGFVNVPRIKGSHNAVLSGIQAADSVAEALKEGRSGDTLDSYETGWRSGAIGRDLKPVRNVKPLWSRYGTRLGVMLGGLDMWTSSKLGFSFFGTLGHGKADHEATVQEFAANPIAYPKPDGVLTFDRLSSVFLSNTNHEEDQPIHLKVADERLQRTSELAPVEIYEASTISGLFLAATMAETERDIPSAADFYRQAYELEPTSDRFIHSAFTMELADGRMLGALDLAAVLAASGDTGMSRLVLALDAVRQRSYRVALRELEAYETDGFGDLVSILIGAWAMYGSGDTEAALESLDSLDGPAWVELYASYHAGMIRLASGDAAGALKDLEDAYATDGGALRLVQGYAQALVANGQQEQAIEVLSGFLELAPANAVVQADLAAAQNGSAMEHRVSTPQQGAAEVLYGLGLAVGQDGAEEVGAIYLNLAMFTHDKHTLSRYGLARIYEDLELWERAIETYEGMIDGHPLKHTSEIRLGVLLDQLDRPDEADAHLQALIDADPNDLEAISTYGSVLRFRQDFERASEVYTQGIETLNGDPRREHWTLYYQRGITYERTDRWTQAEADFLTALDLFPEQPDVMNYLAYTWVDRGENLERSIDMLELAVEMRPDAGYIVDSLGWVYFRLGRFEDAVEQLERAVILDPSQGVIHDHLGDAYWMVGRRLEARFQWSHARDFDDTDERADGYHTLHSLVAFADFGDDISIAQSDRDNLTATGPFGGDVPDLDGNLLGKTLRIVRSWGKDDLAKEPLAIALSKNLPVASGIGGGSADAAALITLLTGGRALTETEEADVLALGADVPMCLDGQSSLISGVGERSVCPHVRFWSDLFRTS
eukprot:g17052.t1